MKQVQLTVVKQEAVTDSVYRLVLEGPVDGFLPGQFINIKIEDSYLRRPFSICRATSSAIELLYQVVGQGTKKLATYPNGKQLDCLIGLGNGFDTGKSQKPLLIAGGIGIAPLLGLAETFLKEGKEVILVYGAKTASELILEDNRILPQTCYLCTEDGSMGFKGNPVEFLKTQDLDFDWYYACGPIPMLKAIKEWSVQGDLSLEARMGCGFGACMGCSIQTTSGWKRICKEGPVLTAREVLFE